MLTKFDTKTKRVKGLCFHPVRPWVLCSLHNGWVQLWNYRMGVKLDQFEEHEGPVRGVDFHAKEPLFVSGGDDYKIKVWNYKLRRCLFTLSGHLDYIRTVQFHQEEPWVVSSSDDQTIRIWNWSTREGIAVLTGHNHYVMCAQFHPKDDLIVSASLDQTVRVWDYSSLRGGGKGGNKDDFNGGGSGSFRRDGNGNYNGGDETVAGISSRINAEFFGGNDVVVKYVLEGHDRGVNWASFHPTLPLIVSGADDNQVKLWRMNETKAWEMDTMRGHSNNVSSVIFHQKLDQDLIISNSEDRSIRVWDVSKRMGVQTYRREHDRFWIIASHPKRNLLAAGHDSGMMVFKLHRERPAFQYYKGRLYYVKDRYLRMVEPSKADRDTPIVSLNRRSSHSSPWQNIPKLLYYNTLNNAESNVLVFSDAEGGSYELCTFSLKGNSANSQGDSRRGNCLAAVFIARNKFAVLDKGRNILIKNLQNETTKKIPCPVHGIDNLYPAAVAGRVILRKDDKLFLYEHTSRRIIAELPALRARRIKWNKDASRVAILCKHSVIIATRDLKLLASVSEMVRVKDGAWDDCGVFIYTTLSHVKYLCANGDCGIVRTMDEVVYITRISKGVLYCLDREMRTREIELDTTEYRFKVALERGELRKVMRLMKRGGLCGNAIIGYLEGKGYPEVALHLTTDEKTKFDLALECGNIEVAMGAAHALDNDKAWYKLGVEALRQGNHQVVEMAYQRTKNYERLSFLYLITGNTAKLKKMLEIAEIRKDVMSQCHNAMYLGDVGERVRVLKNAGQLPLAHVLASTHGLKEEADEIRGKLEEEGLSVPDGKLVCSNPVLCLPPTPIMREDNWPLLKLETTMFDSLLAQGGDGDDNDDDSNGGEEGDGDWALDDDELDLGDDDDDDDDVGDDAWGDDDDLDLNLDDFEDGDDVGDGDDFGGVLEKAMVHAKGSTQEEMWRKSGSSLAVDHVVSGGFETAMELLNRQVGIVNFKELKPYFMSNAIAVETSIPGIPSTNSLRCMVLRNADDRSVTFQESLPRPANSLAKLVRVLKRAYKAFEKGKFAEATTLFRTILLSVLFIVVDTRAEADEVTELVGICKEYLIALALEGKRKGSKSDPKRATELAAYATHCGLQPAHKVLLINVAMTCAFKLKNFINAAAFARTLLELKEGDEGSSLRQKAAKVLRASERQGRNSVKLEYDNTGRTFEMCMESLTPVYNVGDNFVRCPFCKAGVKKARGAGGVCRVCGVGKLGEETLGGVWWQGTRKMKARLTMKG